MTKTTITIDLESKEELCLYAEFHDQLHAHRHGQGHAAQHEPHHAPHGHEGHPHHGHPGQPPHVSAHVPPQAHAAAAQPSYPANVTGPLGAPTGGYAPAPAHQGSAGPDAITFQHVVGLQSELLNNRVINHGQVMAVYNKHGVQPGQQPAPHALHAIYHELLAYKPQ